MDRGAREQQLAEMRRTLERAVGRVCPAWLADRRDDIVQNSMIRVMEIQDRGEESGIRTASYLWKVAYSSTVDEIRRIRRQREEPVESQVLERGNPGTIPDPERQAASREIGEGIRSCLGQMIEPRRLAVLLHLYGFGIKESAAVLGWKAKRADNLLYRGLADLRKCLAAKGLER